MTPEEIENMPEPAWLPEGVDQVAKSNADPEEVEGEIYVLLESIIGNKAALPANKRVRELFREVHVLFRKRLLSALRNAHPNFDIFHCWTETENGILVTGIEEEECPSVAKAVEEILDITYDHCFMEMNDGLN